MMFKPRPSSDVYNDPVKRRIQRIEDLFVKFQDIENRLNKLSHVSNLSSAHFHNILRETSELAREECSGDFGLQLSEINTLLAYACDDPMDLFYASVDKVPFYGTDTFNQAQLKIRELLSLFSSFLDSPDAKDNTIKGAMEAVNAVLQKKSFFNRSFVQKIDPAEEGNLIQLRSRP
jgi:hypothetical protein